MTDEPVEDSTGITDEPDLTLVSLNSTVAGQTPDNPSVATPTSEGNISSSLMSFIQVGYNHRPAKSSDKAEDLSL